LLSCTSRGGRRGATASHDAQPGGGADGWNCGFTKDRPSAGRLGGGAQCSSSRALCQWSSSRALCHKEFMRKLSTAKQSSPAQLGAAMLTSMEVAEPPQRHQPRLMALPQQRAAAARQPAATLHEPSCCMDEFTEPPAAATATATAAAPSPLYCAGGRAAAPGARPSLNALRSSCSCRSSRL